MNVAENGKICTKCQEWKPFSEFYKHKWHKDGLSSWCCVCRSKHGIRRLQKRRLKLVLMRGGRCVKCGESRPWLLTFHHRESEAKLFELRVRNCSRAWNVLITESKKCDLLCHNCHHILHIAPYIDIYNSLIEEILAEDEEPKQLGFALLFDADD